MHIIPLQQMLKKVADHLAGYSAEGNTLVPADESMPVIAAKEENGRLIFWHKRCEWRDRFKRLDQRTSDKINPTRITVSAGSLSLTIAQSIQGRLMPEAMLEHTADMEYINRVRERQQRLDFFRNTIAEKYQMNDRGNGTWHLPWSGADVNIDSDGGLSVKLNTHDPVLALRMLKLIEALAKPNLQ